MKIIRIFEPYLFAFHFPDEAENELKRVLTEWNDPEKMTSFLREHEYDWQQKGYKNLNQLRIELMENSERFEDLLVEYSSHTNPKLDELFAPLHNSEYKEVNISKRKAKNSKRDNCLRIYALKIDSNCYVVTGGAIKFTDLMEDRAHTLRELEKLEFCRNYLRSNGVLDEDSFYDFLLEEYDE